MNEIEIKKLLETIKLEDLIQFKNRLIVQQTRNTQHATRNTQQCISQPMR